VNQKTKQALLEAFASIKTEAEKRLENIKGGSNQNILIGMATCGLASGAIEVKRAFEEALTDQKIDARIIPVGCLGHCYAEPLVIIDKPGFPPILYHNVTPGKANLLVKAFLRDDDPVFEHVLGAMEENELIPTVMEFPRFSQEKRVVMARCGLVDPEDIYQYIAQGGYSALAKALTFDPEQLIFEVLESSGHRRYGDLCLYSGCQTGHHLC
jgi:NADH-quinone oxidoreductase subunit F